MRIVTAEEMRRGVEFRDAYLELAGRSSKIATAWPQLVDGAVVLEVWNTHPETGRWLGGAHRLVHVAPHTLVSIVA